MEDTEFFESRPRRGRWFFLGGVVIVFLIAFRYEIAFIWEIISALPELILDQSSEVLPPVDEIFRVLGFIGINILGVFAFTLFLLFLISQFVLPVRSGSDVWHIIQRVYQFILGRPSLVIFVKEGKLVGDLPEGLSTSTGMVFVDLNSAVVLEKRSMPDSRAGRRLPKRALVRVGRPGLVFIRRDEKLRGVVGLRKQFRINLDVLGHTSDGIEVKTNVFVIFTLGQPTAVIKVAYVGGYSPDNLRVLVIDEEAKKIKAIVDELDALDKAEIHRFATHQFVSPESSTLLEPCESCQEHPPYYFDERRIFNATYSQSRDARDSKLEDWTVLPVLVATDLFRTRISQVTYDSLYMPQDAHKFPLQEDFKPGFTSAMRLMGVISYQLVYRLDGESPEVGQRVDHRLYRISPVQELSASKTLRDRGIKVIHAGFSELKPTDPTIYQQRVENWRARWQQEADIIQADHDLEVMRIRNQARAEKQREIILKLSEILGSPTYSDEAVILRVIQALEDAAADPHTLQLLPKDTINLLRSLRLWMLPDESAKSSLLEEKLSSSENKE